MDVAIIMIILIKMITIKAELIQKDEDTGGYWIYVFKNLDGQYWYNKYLVCVRRPNWEHRPVHEGEIGYLSFEEIKAGKNTWYNGKEMVPYEYDSIQFIRFVKEKENQEKIIM